MSRWKAAGIHLLISVVIALVIGVLFLKMWYPPPFFSAAGADELMLLLVGVDVTLGPLVTLIVFRRGKPGLKFDLAFIGLVQCASLTYGLSVVLQSRPVFLVAAIDRFTLVSANEIDAKSLNNAANPEFRQLSWTGPKLVGAQLPKDEKKRSDLLDSSTTGLDIERLPEFYVPYIEQSQMILTRAKALDALRAKHPESGALIDEVAAKNHLNAMDIAYLPLVTRKHDLSMLFSKTTAMPIQAIPVDPW